MICNPFFETFTNWIRTIHGMVYNAMKLFMEINPQLFDDCSHEYTEQQNSAAAREALRERKWAALSEKANQQRESNSNGAANALSAQTHVNPMPRVDEIDPVTEDNQKRLDSLKLQDGRPNHERENSVASAQ
jgi:serine/threonine-protein phosphatase 2A regulatory subunit B'